MAINTNEVTLHKCREKATELGITTFRVQVSRKEPSKTMSTRVGLFDGATIEMLTSPEMWLPKLYGGGLYGITPYVVEDDGKVTQVGEAMTFQVEGLPLQTSALMLDVIRAADWLGPKRMVWPSASELESTRKNIFDSAAAPPVPGGVGHAPRTQSETSSNGTGGTDPRIDAAHRALEAEKLAWAEKVRALDEAKHKLELDNAKREADARMAKLEAKLDAGVGQKSTNIAEVITAVTTALAPIVTSMMSSQTELRREMLAADAKRSEEQSKLYLTLLDKKDDNAPNLKIATAMAESFSLMNKMQMDMMHTMKETILGPEESGTVTAIKEIGKAMILMGQGAGAGAPKLKALPPPVPAPQAQQPAGRRQVVKTDPVGRLEKMIRAHLDPEVVAEALFASLNEPAMQEALQAAGGNYIALLQERLGKWLLDDANRAYIQNLGTVVSQRGHELGLFADSPDEDVEDDSSEEVADDGDEGVEEEVG